MVLYASLLSKETTLHEKVIALSNFISQLPRAKGLALCLPPAPCIKITKHVIDEY